MTILKVNEIRKKERLLKDEGRGLKKDTDEISTVLTKIIIPLD